MNHIDYLEQVEQIIYSIEYFKLLEYKEFHLDKLSDIFYKCKDTEIFKYVINNAIDLNCVCNIYLWRPIHFICRYSSLDRIKWVIQSGKFNLDLNIQTDEYYNYIDLLSKIEAQKLVEDNIINVRECGYILSKLENQTIEQCQDAIDHDPDNIRFVREDLLRYFN